MDAMDTAAALKSLQEENLALKTLLRELEDATRFKRERELTDSVKATIYEWVKRVAALFVLASAIMGITTFVSAREAVITLVKNQTEPELRAYFTETWLPTFKLDLESVVARRADETTSASTRQFEEQMAQLFKELSKFAKDNNLREPTLVASLDSKDRPKRGFVLKSFLVPSINDTYLIDTYRLNVRDQANGKILGRQIQDARVKITEESEKLGDWVRIEVLPGL